MCPLTESEYISLRLQALQALGPPVTVALCRGAAHPLDSSYFTPGLQGAWGGCTSATTSVEQAASFVNKDTHLKASQGNFICILIGSGLELLWRFPLELYGKYRSPNRQRNKVWELYF